MVGHMLGADPLRLIDERPLLALRQQLPLGAQPFWDLGVVHFWVLLRYLAPFHPWPDHEGVHGPFDVLSTFLFIFVVYKNMDLNQRLFWSKRSLKWIYVKLIVVLLRWHLIARFFYSWWITSFFKSKTIFHCNWRKSPLSRFFKIKAFFNILLF